MKPRGMRAGLIVFIAVATTAGTIPVANASQQPVQPDSHKLVDEYIPPEVGPPAVRSAGAAALVTIDATPEGMVSGSVTDSVGQPVRNEQVWVTATSTEGSIARNATSTQGGTYVVNLPLPSGSYSIVAVVNDVSSTTANVTVTPGVSVLARVRPALSETATVLSVVVRDRGYVAPATIRVMVRERDVPAWRLLHVRESATGRESFAVRPWRNPTYSVRVNRRGTAAQTTVTGRTRGKLLPALPPRGSPVPRVVLPTVGRPIGPGAWATIRPIPQDVWRRMRGVSWRPGCTPRSGLRLVESNYFGFDGYRHRGQIVVSAWIARKVQLALMRLYAGKFRIRQMRPVDAYGRNVGGRPGANDYASMAADNTSGFNCRYVVGKEPEHVTSPHASGRSIDINPWENPFVSGRGVFPNRYFLNRRVGFHGVFRPGVVGLAAVTGVGCRWGGSYADFHHFDC